MESNHQPSLFPEFEQPQDQQPSASDEVAAPASRLGRDNPYAAHEARLRDIADARGEDLQREQTGVPSVTPEQVRDTDKISEESVAVQSLGKQAKQRRQRSGSSEYPVGRYGDTENDLGKPDYYEEFDPDTRLPSEEHKAAMRRHMPGIKEQLAKIQRGK